MARRNRDPATRRRRKKPGTEYAGHWYNKTDGRKVRVKEARPGRPSPWQVTMRLPIRTRHHPGVLINMGSDGVIWCDVDFLQEKFQRVPVPKSQRKRGQDDEGRPPGAGIGPEQGLDADRGDDGA